LAKIIKFRRHTFAKIIKFRARIRSTTLQDGPRFVREDPGAGSARPRRGGEMTDPYPGQPGPGGQYPAGGTPAEPPKRRISARLIIGLILLVLLVIFCAENTRKVRMRLIGPEVQAPLYLPLLIAAVAGVLIGLMIRRRRRRRT
jgi:uncharacterized integral membrane protein